MREMMIHKSHSLARRSEMLRESTEAAALMSHARKIEYRVQSTQISERLLAGGVRLQVGSKQPPGGRPTLTDFVELVSADAGKLQARANGAVWKSSIMLDAAETLLSYSEKQFAIADDARGRVMHL